MINRTYWKKKDLDKKDPRRSLRARIPRLERRRVSYGYGGSTWRVVRVAENEYVEREEDLQQVSEREANLVSSLTTTDMHAPVLDIDVPARLAPSSTPGHSHLYIDHEITWEQYHGILRQLAAAGIIEKGWAESAIRNRMTLVRKPGVYKAETEAERLDRELRETSAQLEEAQAEVRRLSDELARREGDPIMTWS